MQNGERDGFVEGEAAMVDQLVAMNLKTMFVRNGVARRGQHPKHHACAVATFDVLEDVPAVYRVGVFAVPRRYSALVRFSNGSTYDDREPDAHGMAIKLLDVDGHQLLPDSMAPRSQDFILSDHPVFFSRTLEEYLVFNRYFTKIIDFKRNWREDIAGFLPRLMGLVHGALALWILHGGLLRRARRFAGATPSSLLASNFWSTTPYLLGNLPVKYIAKAEAHAHAGPVTSFDGLGEVLRAQLARGKATFAFGVHPQIDPVTHPIEDTTVDWHSDPDAFVPLARITLPRQSIEKAEGASALAERIVFSPWHALEEHQPLGSINRARKRVYEVMARMRHEANGTHPPGAAESSQFGP
jgi:hypothetical protein